MSYSHRNAVSSYKKRELFASLCLEDYKFRYKNNSGHEFSDDKYKNLYKL